MRLSDLAETEEIARLAAGERVFLSDDEAIARLTIGDRVHCLVNPSGMLLGADWDRAEVLAMIRVFGAEESGELASRMNHGICVIPPSGSNGNPMWFATK